MTMSQSHKIQKKPTHYQRNICLAIVAMLICILIFIFSAIHHYQGDLQCACFSCLTNRSTQEEDYTYNRYLPLISFFCMLLILLPLYIFNHRQKKRETRSKNSH
ncbi:hypothetical protein [Bacteroides reticulotermitis]|uniref:hypothetical protein n=1 Tax=Bacteroides reticulotermitis TaxID=1133319 RepID=UPI003A840A7C